MVVEVDFCVISVRAFFVNFFEHTKGYVNEQNSNFSSKHPKWDQNLQFTSQSETTSIPISFIWKPPPPPPFTPRQRWTPYQFHLGCWRVRGHVSYPAVYSINLFSYCLTCSLRVLLSEPNHPVVQNYVILCIRGRQGYRICEEAGETRWTAGWSQAIPYVWHLFHGYNTRCSDLLRPPFAKTALIPR